MKINPLTNPNILRSYQAVKPASAQKKSPTGTSDEVTFSEGARSFTKVMSDVKDTIRAEGRTKDEQARIDELTEAVRQGRYRIDSDKVAERILESIGNSW